jgi:MFS family permease
MLVARFFNGLCGSGFMSVAGETVGDLFNVYVLALPMMVYTASPFIGPEFGPPIGGFTCQNVGRRWVFYVLIIWSSLAYVATVVAVLDTYSPILLKKREGGSSERLGEEGDALPGRPRKSILSTAGHSCLRPI